METTLTSKGQIVIPSPIRKQLHLDRGTRFEVSVRDNEIVLRPVQTRPAIKPTWTPHNPTGRTLSTEALCQPVTLDSQD